MEGRKKVGSSSSLTSELFGSKDSCSSSRIFGAIFSPPSKVLGRESVRSEMPAKKRSVQEELLSTKLGAPDGSSKSSESRSENITNNDLSAIYQDQRVQPCHLSSSIYYGGQDIYSYPQSTQSSGLRSVVRNWQIKEDGGEDDSGIASRGNWWQGSLYY